MASTIKLKNSTTAGNSPTSLETGEVAINVADGNLFYGSASAVLQNFVVDELQVKGNLTAQQYIVSSSVTYTTQSFSSGSTAFGDSADDSHEFTGNITASGDISASGTVTANSLVGSHTLTTAAQPNVTSLGTLTTLTVDTLKLDNNLLSSTADADVAITLSTNGIDFAASSGDKFKFNQTNQDNIDFVVGGENDLNLIYADASTDNVGIGDATPTAKLDVAGNINTTSHITASGNISASGNILGSQFKSHDKIVGLYHAASSTIRLADTSNLTRIYGTNITLDAPVTASIISASGDIIGDTLTVNAITFPQDTNITIQTPDEDESNGAGGNLTIEAGNGNGSNGDGGDLIFNAGKSTGGGDSGDIIFNTFGTTVGGGTSGSLIINSKNLLADVDGNITSSGNISSSGTIVANKIESDQLVSHAGDANTGLQFASDTVIIEGNNVNIARFASSYIELNKETKITLEKSSTTDGDANGDIVYFGGESGTIAEGQIVYYNSSGQWALADADAESSADGLLGVALGGDASTDGILLKGMVTLDHDPGTIGDPLFLSTTPGQASSTAPNGANDIVRLIGYCLDNTNGQIYFNPSNDFIKHT